MFSLPFLTIFVPKPYYCVFSNVARFDVKPYTIYLSVCVLLMQVALYFSEFHIQLENPHVITSDQVWVGTLAKGPDSVTLSSAYETR